MVNLDKIKEANDKLEAAKQAFKEESKTLFRDACTELFEENPKLEYFSWTQYTQYFNDGDQTTFSANTDYPDINGESSSKVEYSKWTAKYRAERGETYEKHELADIFNEVKKFLGSFRYKFYEAAFGDHVKVTVSRDGNVEIEDYTDHD